jgi:cytoskeletal protein CcmA (bactofilin family)
MRKLWQNEQEQSDRPKAEADLLKQPAEKSDEPRGAERAELAGSEKSNGASSMNLNQALTSPPRSFVGSAMIINGEVEAEEDLLVSGQIEGSVSMPEHCLTVSPGGCVHASISAKSVVVEGEVQGDIDCSDLVVLKATARVTGDIRMRRINIVDGAVYNGKVTMRAPEG